MRQYKPRRASLKRWLEGAPDYIIDCFDDPRTIDRYTVIIGGDYLIGDSRADMYVPYLGMSDSPSQGFSQWGELRAWELSGYRYRNGHYRVRWADLPKNIRDHVLVRVEGI